MSDIPNTESLQVALVAACWEMTKLKADADTTAEQLITGFLRNAKAIASIAEDPLNVDIRAAIEKWREGV